MNEKLQEIAYQINTGNVAGGNVFSAVFNEAEGTVTVENSTTPDATVIVVATDTQILTITPLFEEDSVREELRAELNRGMLTISLPMALSSVGLQDNRYVLFGAMAIETTMANLIHEIEVQIDNYNDVLEAVADYIQ
ncbi:MAG: DUF2170 family protein [Arenicella sp.]